MIPLPVSIGWCGIEKGYSRAEFGPIRIYLAGERTQKMSVMIIDLFALHCKKKRGNLVDGRGFACGFRRIVKRQNW